MSKENETVVVSIKRAGTGNRPVTLNFSAGDANMGENLHQLESLVGASIKSVTITYPDQLLKSQWTSAVNAGETELGFEDWKRP